MIWNKEGPVNDPHNMNSDEELAEPENFDKPEPDVANDDSSDVDTEIDDESRASEPIR